MSTPSPEQVAKYLAEKECCSGFECGCVGVSRLQWLVQEAAGEQIEAERVRALKAARELALQREYSAYLAEGHEQTAGYLHVHNWKYDPQFLARGDELRAKIAALTPPTP